MYIAHKCFVCKDGDIVYALNDSGCYSCSCGHTENEDAFWSAYHSEGYCRELEAEIDNRFPFRSISILGNTVDLAVGWHVLGKFENRDLCIESFLQDAREILDKWQVCYCDFSRFDKRADEFHKLSKGDTKYMVNLQTLKAAFANLPQRMKEQYK